MLSKPDIYTTILWSLCPMTNIQYFTEYCTSAQRNSPETVSDLSLLTKVGRKCPDWLLDNTPVADNFCPEIDRFSGQIVFFEEFVRKLARNPDE